MQTEGGKHFNIAQWHSSIHPISRPLESNTKLLQSSMIEENDILLNSPLQQMCLGVVVSVETPWHGTKTLGLRQN